MTNITYTRLEAPLELIVNKDPTSEWYLGTDGNPVPINTIAEGTAFVAAGKAQRKDGDKACYYMREEDFGNAVETGAPAHAIGVSTLDLSLAETKVDTESHQDVETPTSALDEPTEGIQPLQPLDENAPQQVPVRVIPANPLKWQKTYTSNLGTLNYTANGDYRISDLSGDLPDAELKRGMIVPVAGCFEKDGVKYLRTAKSVTDGSWYGIPESQLWRGDDMDDELLDDIFNTDDDNDLRGKLDLDPRETAIKAGATIKGKFERILNLGKKK